MNNKERIESLTSIAFLSSISALINQSGRFLSVSPEKSNIEPENRINIKIQEPTIDKEMIIGLINCFLS